METEDGNEDVCGACTDIGDLICCESCPAAYHADCAGYVNPHEVPAGDWYCWPCCIQRKRSYPFPTMRFRQDVGSTVFVGIEGRLDSFYKGTVEQLGPDSCTVLYNETEGEVTLHRREQLGRRNHRLWHGTAHPKAWEKGAAAFEWHPLSRRYAVAQSVKQAAAPSTSQAAAPAAAAAPVPPKRPRNRPTAAVQPVRSSSASLPPPAAASFMAAGIPPNGPASRGLDVAPRSIVVGTLGAHVPIMYRPQGPAMQSFPPNAIQTGSQAPAATNSQSRSTGKKKAPTKKRRRSKAASTSEESSSSSEDSQSDSANSGISQSGFGAGSVTNHVHRKHAKHAKHAKHKGTDSEAGVMSRQDEEEFYEALTKFWTRQGTGGKRILAKYQPFESMRLTSGMPTFGAHHYWAAVMALGGHSMATEKKAWAGVGRLFSPPRSMTTISHTFKSAYEKLLLPFEEATRRGETGIALPQVTGKLPPLSAVKARQSRQHNSLGGYGGPSSSGHSQTDDSDSGSDAPRDRQKYLRVMTQSRGRVKDYGETPVKRARLALEGFTWGCPTLPTAADLAGMDDVMVAGEATMSQQAADLAPGTHVEYRSREPYLIGGWFRAQIVQVATGSAAEGGCRFLLDCTDFDADSASQGQGNLRAWVPLVYPDANGIVPHVMIRLPLQPERPPTADKRWREGDRVEGFWQNAWWTSTVKDIEADGTVVCLSDATPVYPEGEEWEVERENLRAGHPQEASGFGMLDLADAPDPVHKTLWGEKIKARKFRVDGFSIEAFPCQLHMGPADSARAEDDARLQLAATNPSPPPPERKSPSPPSNSPTPSPSPSPGSGSGSGTTQSASVEDQTPPLAPTEKGRDPGASLSQPQDPDSWQGLIDAVSKGRPVKRPVKPVKWPAGSHQPCASEILADGDIALRRQDGRSHSTGRKQGLALSSGCPAPGLPSALLTSTSKKKESLGRGKGDAGIPNGVGDQELRHSPPGSPPAVKLEFEQDSWQQAQHASRAFVKFEPGGYDIQGGVVEEEAGLRRQGHWQAAWETPQAQHAQHVAQPRDSKLKWTPELHSRFVRCVGQLGGLQKAKPKKILKMMSDGNQGLTKERIKNYLQRFKQSLRLPEVQSGEVSPAVSDAERQTCAQPLPTDSGFPPSQAPFPPSQTDLARPNTSHGFTFPSQPPPHEPLLSVADAEAQLFFMSPSPAMLPTAGMGAPVPNGFPPDSGPLPPLPPHCRSLQNQPLHAQHHLYCQQQRQQQWLTLQHQQHLMLERRQQHHHQHLMGFSSKQQQSVQASKASQGLRVPHPQKQPPLTRTNSAQHAMPAEPSQPPASVPSSLNGLSGAPQDSSRTQHAKHGANGYSKHQQGANGDSKPLQGARGTSPHQKAQHAQHGTNGVLNPSGQSMQSGQLNSRSGSGVSTAFILWVDGQYKSKGQVEKRAALRSFVQSAKEETATSRQLAKVLTELVGEDMIREWQMLYRAGWNQAGAGTPPPTSNSQRATPPRGWDPSLSGSVPFLVSTPAGVSNSFPIHATPAQYPGVTGALPLSPSQFHYPADDAQLPTSHAQRSVAQVWPSAEQAQSHIRMAPPTQSMAFDSQRFSMPRHPGFAAHGPQNSTSAFIQDPSRLPSHSTAWGMTDLMQQGSAMLINTTRALQGLAKQDSSMPSGKGSHHVLPFHSHNEGDMTSCVEIIDVTESADDASQPVSAQSDALPFPSVTLPFEVP